MWWGLVSPGLSDVVGAENVIQAGQAACSYSWSAAEAVESSYVQVDDLSGLGDWLRARA